MSWTCDNCGDELDDEFPVHIHELSHPVRDGYWNPADPSTWTRIVLGDTEVPFKLCGDCRVEEPPAPSRETHKRHVKVWTILSFLGIISLASGANGGALLIGIATVAFAGEMYQLGQIEESDAETRNEPAGEAREAFLAGEITEDELEERLDEELDDTEPELLAEER